LEGVEYFHLRIASSGASAANEHHSIVSALT
jgi:hypothetical protein